MRCHLHYLTGRATDQLSFDVQVGVAERMGYTDPAGRRAVEIFMQDYFRHATRVGELTRIFLTQLEARHAKAEASLMGLFARRKRVKAGLKLVQGRLDVEDPAAFLADKLNLLRVFEEALRTGYLLHPNVMRLIAANLDLIDDEMRSDREAVQIFLDLMLKHGNPERALRRMNELGVLAAFIPEFEADRRDDAVQRLSPLHGGRAHHPVHQHAGADRARRTGRGTARRQPHPDRGREPPGAVCRAVPARYRQGPPRGSFDPGRTDRAARRAPPGPDGRGMRDGRMAGALSPADVGHRAEARPERPAHGARLRQGGEDERAAGPADRADGLRHSRRGAGHLEQLEGHAAAPALRRHAELRWKAGSNR